MSVFTEHKGAKSDRSAGSGITLGRIILPRLNLLIGEKNVVFVYLAVVLALEMVIWFANQLIAASVAVALVGFALGVLISYSEKPLHADRPLPTAAVPERNQHCLKAPASQAAYRRDRHLRKRRGTG